MAVGVVECVDLVRGGLLTPATVEGGPGGEDMRAVHEVLLLRRDAIFEQGSGCGAWGLSCESTTASRTRRNRLGAKCQ